MGAWKHDACYEQERYEDEQRRTYGAEQDYLHGLYAEEQLRPIVDRDPGDEQPVNPRETAHNTK